MSCAQSWLGLKPQKGFIPMASTVDDKYIAGSEMNADYWVRNLRQTVLRMNGIRTLLQDGYTTFLEVSPCPVAWNALRETFRHFGADATAVASLRHAEGAQEALCKAAGALYAQGISPDWAAMFRAEDRRFVPLPTYCWEDKPCWFKATQEDRAVPAATLASSAPAAPKADSRTQFLDQLKSLPSAQRRQFLLEHLQRMVGQILGGRDSRGRGLQRATKGIGIDVTHDDGTRSGDRAHLAADLLSHAGVQLSHHRKNYGLFLG